MAKIRVLPEVLASQVAAGEVVERPASVIKELVENSLDAGARQIEVRVDRGGTAFMRVSDDGCGMGRDDALLSLERHATSKLRDSAELATIRTLGFRGEALPSIASVSRFILATREQGELAGTEIVADGGTLREVRDWGGAPGTVMEVRDLFFNVPARRKFLRSENTEFGHIEQTVRVQALAHPEVGFTLLRDGRIIFQLPCRAPLPTRIAGLIGSDLAATLIERTPVEHGGLRIHGWLSQPGRGRADRTLSLVFVNGRAVENPALSFALRAAYGDTMARGQHPLCFLFVEMDPAAVDVNVHPAKREVRFRDGLGVQASLAAVLQECLRSSPGGLATRSPMIGKPVEWIPRSERKPRDGIHPFPGQEPPSMPIPTPRPTAAPVQSSLPVQPSVRSIDQPAPATASVAIERTQSNHEGGRQENPDAAPHAAPHAAPATGTPAKPVETPEPSPSDMAAAVDGSGRVHAPAHYHLLGQLSQSFALFESAEGLVIMNLRAAHERVLYEALRSQSAAAPAAAQPLLVPLVLTLPPRDAALVRDHLTLLQRLGFGLEEFGTNTLKIESLPAQLPQASDPASWFSDLLHEIARSGENAARIRLDFDALAATVAARATPRSTTHTEPEIMSLLKRLLACDMPYCDPLGRPTLIQFSHQELARKFGRRPA